MSDQNSSQSYNAYNFQTLPSMEPNSTVQTTVTISSRDKLRKFMPIILILAGALLLIIIALLIFGGRSSTNNINNGTITDPNKAVVLQWWGAFIDPAVIQPLIDEYKIVKPNVTLEYANKWPNISYLAAEDKYKTEVNRVLKLNDSVQLPDLFMLNNHWIGDYEKYISPSTNITFTEFQNTYYPAVITDFGGANKVQGLPLWMDTLAVLYNKEMLAAESVSVPPTDWSQFRSLAQKLTKKSGNNIIQAGFAGGTSANVTYSFELANILLLQNGVTILDSLGKPVFSTDPDSLTSFGFLDDFQKTTNATWSNNLRNDAAAFLEEDLAMMVAPSYRLRDLLKYNEGYNLNLEIGISGLPQLTGQEQPIINWGDYWGNVVTLNRPNKDYAWEFLKWLNEPAQLKSLSANVKNDSGYFGNLYPRKDMSTENQNDDYLKIYNDSLPYIKSWYMVNGTRVKASFFDKFDSTVANQGNISSFEDAILDIIADKGKLE